MSATTTFDFNSDAIARAYDDVLVPHLFEPWAEHLVETEGPWDGLRVLDLATGTGIVASLVADRVGPSGKTVAADINASMLALAMKRCGTNERAVEFVTSPAHPLDLPTESVDAVLCQQGFQFFPDRGSAASEMLRVLVPGGRVAVSTWRPVWECEFFGAICQALSDIGEGELCSMMRRPFDFIDGDELAEHFETAGFKNVAVRLETRTLTLAEGVSQALQAAYATPIGPALVALPQSKRNRFGEALTDRLSRLTLEDGCVAGRMAANVLTGRRGAA